MKFFEAEIANYEQKLALMKKVQEQLDVQGLLPNHPAISISSKKPVMLTTQVNTELVKDKTTGIETLQVRVVGYSSERADGGHWFLIEDLAPYSDASRVLYLK